MRDIPYRNELLFEIVILIIFLQPMFTLGILTDIGYLLAIGGAVKSGMLFNKPNMGRLIVVGTILSYIAGQIFVSAIGSENIISFILIASIAAYMWLKGYFWKKGNPI